MKKKKNRRFWIMMTPLILLILGCFIYIGYLLYGYFTAGKEYEMTREGFVDEPIETQPEEPEPVSPFPDRDIDVDGLLAQNPDFVFWLYYEDGKVDYPVVKEREEDINGYLYRTFEGQKNSAGCVFIPYDANEGLHDLNTFVYGHNMRNGSMFGSLKNLYRDPEENFKDPYFFVWTKDHERIMYRVIGMYVVDKDDEMYSVPKSAAGYETYLKMVLAHGSTAPYKEFSEDEESAMGHCNPIVTLSACYGPAGTRNRLLIQGVELLREDF